MKITADRARELNDKISTDIIAIYLTKIEFEIVKRINEGVGARNTSIRVPNSYYNDLNKIVTSKGFKTSRIGWNSSSDWSTMEIEW